ncbi:hypothetical protein [Ideonella alba]|uniref:Tetratricopeptide repeat protein n=1 Tax=Ideonella alba TaxID=2824118 RepID=A0A940YAH1_9BURK|nr:hypothetical protein [Ideonella alba]MBQ0931581.1 hypothetical protein [Ideonella alba]
MKRLLLSLALAAAVPAQAAVDPPPVRALQAPHWGDGLFFFFQDRHFDALSALMVSQHFDRLGLHGDEAALLRGGLLLAWGMHDEAAAVFERLLTDSADAAVRDRAWYFLAQVRYARGLDDEAQTALDRIGAPLADGLEPARALLAAQVALARQQPDAAAAALTALAEQPYDPSATTGPARSWWARFWAWLGVSLATDPQGRPVDDAPLYARYNLGVALVRAGRLDEGRPWLERLGTMPAAHESQRALRDQANLALGYAALQASEPEAARTALERVRLQGPSSAKALLGFGWADLALKNPRRALLPWQELAGRDPGDAAVLESRIAIPYALAELGADTAAEAAYSDALTRFDTEQQRLQATQAELQRDAWLDALVALNPADAMAWSRSAETLPPLPHAAQLAPVLADHAFQEGYKTLRDLQFLHAHLSAWQGTIASYRDMLAHRRAVFEQRLPALAAEEGQLAVAPLQRQQAALETALTAAESSGDGQAFADERQRALQQRIARVRAALQDLPPEQQAAHAERLRLLAGRLQWDLAQAAPEAAWTTRRALQASARALDEAQARRQRFSGRPTDQRQAFDDFARRLDALDARITRLLPPLQRTAREQAGALQHLALAALQTQQQRLGAYAQQARYGIAQLHDRARQPLDTPEATDAPR